MIATGKRIDLTGLKFSHLTVIEYVGKEKYGQTIWKCKCDCGNYKDIRGSKLRSGEVKSCGCMRHPYKHHMTDTRMYNIWCTMKARCFRPTCKKYKDYGGRGITMCDEWKNDFMSFYEWSMSNGYSDELSIDRIDNNGSYEPSNCRWADAITQSNNTRTNVYLTYQSETHTLAEWSRILGISYSTMIKRRSKGLTTEEILKK